MSNTIDQAFVDQFTSNFFHLSQQKGSRLRAFVRPETQRGKAAFFERVGLVEAIEKAARHQDTPLQEVPHSRRRVTLRDFEWADLIDNSDRIRTLIDPESAYSQQFMWALGRAIDREILDKMDGNAFSGQDGSTSVALPLSQRIVATDGATAAGVNLNVATLRRAKEKFDENDVDESIRRYLAYTANQLQALLTETEVTSSDFNVIRALVQGEVNTFLGFQFVRTQLLGRPDADLAFLLADGSTDGATDDTLIAATARVNIAWAQDGMVLSVGQNPVGRISERDDKSYSTQVFAQMSVGATRLEEVKVVQINVKES